MLRRIHPDLAQMHLRVAHRELRAAWRAGSLPHWRFVLAPLLALCLLGSALPGPWRWIAGLGSGLGVSLWLVLGDRLARVERWRTKAGSAHRTLRVMDRLLDEGWQVAPDEGLVLVGTPVVVIWGDFAAGACVDTGVAYVHGDGLAAWLSAHRPGLRSVPSLLAAA